MSFREYWRFVNKKTDREVQIERPLFFIQAMSFAIALPIVDVISLTVWKWSLVTFLETCVPVTIIFGFVVFFEILWSFTPRDWRSQLYLEKDK